MGEREEETKGGRKMRARDGARGKYIKLFFSIIIVGFLFILGGKGRCGKGGGGEGGGKSLDIRLREK